MESNTRLWTKALTWQLLGLISTSLLAYFFLGSITLAGSLALSSMASALVLYVIHEKLWAKVNWGKTLVLSD